MRTPTTPYRVTKSEGVTYVIDDKALLVAKIYDWPDQTVEGKHANLFAAAPDMYEALELLLRCYTIPDVGKGRTTEQHVALVTARAALAKAQPTSAD